MRHWLIIEVLKVLDADKLLDTLFLDGFSRYCNSSLGGREKVVPSRSDAAFIDD